jgi:hypothetical protein
MLRCSIGMRRSEVDAEGSPPIGFPALRGGSALAIMGMQWRFK